MARQGRLAEEFACRFLQRRGLELLARNYYCRRGEIDLVMNDSGCIVFVEVRYRGNPRFGTAAETVDRRKQARLIAAAQHYLQRHRAAAGAPCRFDVISVSPASSAQPLQWIRDAFQL
ncbi:MAG TPA: YraN family protein [Gammaproteobacteria bacterium]|nr:YraN family protein [Gammaproteobacteria bacterium]